MKLKPGQAWLLQQAINAHHLGMREYGKPCGITRHIRVMPDCPEPIDGNSLRALVRRGLLTEGNRIGIHYATEKALTEFNRAEGV